MKKYPYGGRWIRKHKLFWGFIWQIITWPFRQRWTLIELIMILILIFSLARSIHRSGGFFKVHRAESISLPIKVHNFATREPTKLEKFLRLTSTVNIPENSHDILATKKKRAPNFGA